MNRGAWQATIHVVTKIDMAKYAQLLAPSG